jgi:solute carrier family 25 citrate transporter 1
MIHATRSIITQEGIQGLYRGVVPTILRQGANSAIRFSAYAQLQSLWAPEPGKKIASWKSFLSGALAGTTSTILTMPVDVIKTRLQGVDAGKYRGVIDCARQIFQQEGIKTFWKGTTPRLGRVVASSGIVFSIQDFIIHFISE